MAATPAPRNVYSRRPFLGSELHEPVGCRDLSSGFRLAWYRGLFRVVQLVSTTAHPPPSRQDCAGLPGAGDAAPGLSITEYNNGCEGDISGGVAEADTLGVFGREGVFAAAAWPLSSLSGNYLLAAFDLYRNYDGLGSIVGDTTVHAATSDDARTSIYAFAHSEDRGAVDLVAINKTNASVPASISLGGASSFRQAVAYALLAGRAAVVPKGTPTPVICADNACALSYEMPPMSATTLIVR